MWYGGVFRRVYNEQHNTLLSEADTMYLKVGNEGLAIYFQEYCIDGISRLTDEYGRTRTVVRATAITGLCKIQGMIENASICTLTSMGNGPGGAAIKFSCTDGMIFFVPCKNKEE